MSKVRNVTRVMASSGRITGDTVTVTQIHGEASGNYSQGMEGEKSLFKLSWNSTEEVGCLKNFRNLSSKNNSNFNNSNYENE
jgi:hypothetical protein